MTTENRIERLESDNNELQKRVRRSERALTVVGVGAVLFVATAALPVDPTILDVVRAERIEVVASASDPRVLASIGPTPEGRGMINTYGDEGRLLFSMRPDVAGHGSLHTFNQNGYPIFEAAADNAGLGWMAVYDDRGMPLAGFRSVREAGALYLNNGEGVTLVEAHASKANDGVLRTYHSSGERLISLSHDEAADGLIIVRDRGGRFMAILGSGDGGGSLGLVDWETKSVERFGAPLAEPGGDKNVQDDYQDHQPNDLSDNEPKATP
ncbi:MAG: hypothetical protein ACI8TX_000869 [Hyphomicrobiaceae bacterium]|jgi:hypothetical protein